MKKFLIIVLSLTLATVAGWLSFSISGDKATITLDKNEIRKDTQEAIDTGKNLLDKASEKARDIDEKDAGNDPVRKVRSESR